MHEVPAPVEKLREPAHGERHVFPGGDLLSAMDDGSGHGMEGSYAAWATGPAVLRMVTKPRREILAW